MIVEDAGLTSLPGLLEFRERLPHMMVSVIAKALQLILLVRETGAARAGPLKGSDAVASDAGLYSVRTKARR